MNELNVVIDVAELVHLLQSAASSVRLIDCRFNLADTGAGRLSYVAGHLPNAVFADLERDLSGPIIPGTTGRHPLPEPAELAARFSSWGIQNETWVVAYDDGSCMFAPRLWWLLRWLGHSRVVVLRGGLAAWSQAGEPLSHDVPSFAKVTFEVREPLVSIASVEEVASASAHSLNAAVALIDARGEVRYRGEQEPIDPVAGHIPGARNLPYTSLIAEGGPRPSSQIRAAFESALGPSSPGDRVAYCGSGVTACALIWAAESANLTGIRLYPGSWSEWLTDPSRPVARGDE